MSASTWRQPVPAPLSTVRAAAVREVADRILRLGPGRLRVAVDGPTAAGKTSLGHELAEAISAAGRAVLRATLDDFKRPWNERHLYDRVSGEGYYRNAFDYAAVRRLLLEPFGAGEPGRVALCAIDPLTQIDHSDVVDVPPDGVLIVDGVFAFRPEIDAFWDFRIWVDVDEEESLRRGAERDHDWAGSEAEAIHRERYLPAVRLYIDLVGPQGLADVLIDNRDVRNPEIT
jgi:uridine kinase